MNTNSMLITINTRYTDQHCNEGLSALCNIDISIPTY